MQWKKIAWSLGLLAVVLSTSSLAGSGVTRFLVAGSSAVSSEEEAAPYIQRFGGFLAGKLGWKDTDYEVKFSLSAAKTADLLSQWKPAYAAIPLDLYLKTRGSVSMKPLMLAQVQGKSTTRYRLLTSQNGPNTVSDFKGKTIHVALQEDPLFVQRVVFRGQLTIPGDVTMESTNRPLRVLRKVASGKADGIVLDSAQYESLKELPLFKDLKVVYESPEVPLLGIVSLPGNVAQDQEKAFATALGTMCSDGEGKGICEMANLDAFVPAPAGVLDEVVGWYEGK